MALKLFWLWVPPAVGSHRSSCCYLCDSSAVLNPLSCWEPLFKLLLSKAFKSPQRLKALIQAAAIYGSSAVLSLSSFWEPSFKQLFKALKLFWIPSAVGSPRSSCCYLWLFVTATKDQGVGSMEVNRQLSHPKREEPYSYVCRINFSDLNEPLGSRSELFFTESFHKKTSSESQYEYVSVFHIFVSILYPPPPPWKCTKEKNTRSNMNIYTNTDIRVGWFSNWGTSSVSDPHLLLCGSGFWSLLFSI